MARWNKVPRSLWVSGGMLDLDPLPYSTTALYLYLRTCDRPTRVAGLMRGPATIADDTGWLAEGVREGVRELVAKGLVTYSERPAYILCHEALVCDLPGAGNDTAGVLAELAELPQCEPVTVAQSIVRARSLAPLKEGVREGVREGVPKPESREQRAESREQRSGRAARGVPLRASTEWEEVGAPAAPPGVEDRACALWRRLLSSSDHMQLQRQLHGRPLDQYRPPQGQLEPLVRLCQEHTDAELAPAVAKATAADKPRAYLLSMVGADGRLSMEPRRGGRGKPYREQESRYTSDLSSLVFAEEA